MPAHPERLAAFAVAGALALSLLLGVAWRDQIACGLVEASGLTMIGPKIFADAPVDAQESALLLDRARESRARAAAAHDQSSDEAVLIFSDSNFWRGDADARVIRTPFRACVVIGPHARGLDTIASELARVGPARREALKAPAATATPASEPDRGGDLRAVFAESGPSKRCADCRGLGCRAGRFDPDPIARG